MYIIGGLESVQWRWIGWMRRDDGWSVSSSSLRFGSGMLLGVSFLATPVKFLAPSLSLPVALDVGRHTFLAFNKTEWVLSIMLLVVVMGGGRNWKGMLGAVIAVVVVAMETVWLLPSLDSRVALIIAGQQPAPSSLHTLYIVCEVLKLVALLVIIIGAVGCIVGNGRLAASGPPRSAA